MSSQTLSQNRSLESEAAHLNLGDKYEMRRLLATGGAARIFLARQIDLDRDVVVKVLRQPLNARPDAGKQFLLEARLLARLEHPNIVQIIDFGEQEGYCFFVMEYVRGGSLRSLIDRVPLLPLDVALSIAYFVLRGIAYVHERQVLHLDLKPANILVTKEAVIKVADFGLARLASQNETRSSPRPQAGTPLYMAPEQVLGAKLDERSDIFSLGVLLYQLLCGKPPFTGQSADEVYLKILACRVTPPSTLRPEIPDFVENLVMSSLQRDRNARHAAVASMLEDCAAALQKLSVHRPEERVSRFLSEPAQYRGIIRKPTASRAGTRALRRSLVSRLKWLLVPLLAFALLALEIGLTTRLR